ncbi:MAG: serine hydrolase [Lachnospiraceae bacterium]|nr:serine hydrolase [Lachnospiraceae bacterium]
MFAKKGECLYKIISALLFFVIISTSLCGCGTKYSNPYTIHNSVSAYNVGVMEEEASTFPAFAEDLCVVSGNVNTGDLQLGSAVAASLFDLNNKETLYTKNPNAQMHPASLTKIMTALVAMKYAQPDLMLTASENVKIDEPGAQLMGLKPGDQMTLDQALHVLLIYSANDVAIMIAEGIGGTVEGFCDLMNEEAISIGATNSHFTNPNGLTQDEHYVTPYDMYLIFRAALQYSLFNEIIQMPTYETVYYAADGTQKELSIESTVLYIKGGYTTPDQITVIGGKTGTTSAAGHCLILYTRDSTGSPYIAILMNAESADALYEQMNQLLDYITQ